MANPQIRWAHNMHTILRNKRHTMVPSPHMDVITANRKCRGRTIQLNDTFIVHLHAVLLVKQRDWLEFSGGHVCDQSEVSVGRVLRQDVAAATGEGHVAVVKGENVLAISDVRMQFERWNELGNFKAVWTVVQDVANWEAICLTEAIDWTEFDVPDVGDALEAFQGDWQAL